MWCDVHLSLKQAKRKKIGAGVLKFSEILGLSNALHGLADQQIWEFRKAADEESFINKQTKNGTWTTASDGMDEKECSHFILDQDGNILSQ